jgi:hypothetical protein
MSNMNIPYFPENLFLEYEGRPPFFSNFSQKILSTYRGTFQTKMIYLDLGD